MRLNFDPPRSYAHANCIGLSIARGRLLPEIQLETLVHLSCRVGSRDCLAGVSANLSNVVEYNTFDLTSQGGTHLLYWVVGEVMAHLKTGSNEVKLELHKNVEEALRQEGLDAETLNPFEYSDFLKKKRENSW